MYLTFYLTSDKTFFLEFYLEGKRKRYQPISHPAINGFGKTNKLVFEQIGDDFNFYVNGELIQSLKKYRVPGCSVGYDVSSESSLSVDKLLIYQKPAETKYVKGFTSEKKELLGKNINSKEAELGPSISPDGNYLFFARREDPNDINDEHACDDSWISEKSVTGEWGPAKKLPYPINDEFSNDIISISPDNNTLFMSDTACHATSVFSFFVSNKTATGWSKPVSNTIKNGYNLCKYSSATVSSDGQIVIVSMMRKDTEGGIDLYMVRKIGEREWSEPLNLGPVVNGFSDDGAPFLAHDGKTLYFASDSRRGLGDMDIYMSKRLDESWTKWSEPENMGPSVNSAGWDMYYIVDAQAEYAYLCSSDLKNPNEDIYRIKLPKEAKPEPVVMIYGKVINEKTKQAITATITYEDLSTGKSIGEAKSDPKTGEYKIVLPYGKTYGYHASVKGYISVSENLDLSEIREFKEIKQDLSLHPITVGETIKLNNVFFEQGKEKLLSQSYSELDRLVEILKNNPTMEIELRGHTDNIGDPKLNLQLSEKRVKVVKDYLLNKGIQSSRISGKGFGGSMPAASNDQEESRKLNRRVEIKIIKE